ncbi:hypothetical protein AERO8C_110001 [Aeromonas veronii]|uniref:Uncharacterized protein n=1 Tax=Aeromonas veronii TaxID=654 RepID=A0A653KPH4_AERVE|nr:hypothetical protein AERO8C_110001 [Aeromonas veronii]
MAKSKPVKMVGNPVKIFVSLSKIAHSKKAFPIGKAFKLVAERTGLEPATPGVTGRYSNRLNYRSAFG